MSGLTFNNSTVANPFREELDRYLRRVNYMAIYVQVCICIFGLVGNLLALIVINQKSLKNTSSAVFITYMAIFDSAVLIFHTINLAKLPRHLWLHCTLTFYTDLSIFCANWTLVIITLGRDNSSFQWNFSCFSLPLERCVAVYSPFLARRFCTMHSARCSMYILISISAAFFFSTFFFIYEVRGASIHGKCRIKQRVRSFHRIYQTILFIVIPDILLLSNLFTVYSLCRRRQQLAVSYNHQGEQLEMRVSDVHSNRKQRQLTIMLVTVSLSFYIFTTPAMISFITEMYPPKGKRMDRMKRAFLMGQISVFMSELNNAVSRSSIPHPIDLCVCV